jgi:hypothetical protein
MSTFKAADWLVVAMVAILAAGTLVYFDPPTRGRAFTKNASSPQQTQVVSGGNHKRTSSDFNW